MPATCSVDHMSEVNDIRVNCLDVELIARRHDKHALTAANLDPIRIIFDHVVEGAVRVVVENDPRTLCGGFETGEETAYPEAPIHQNGVG